MNQGRVNLLGLTRGELEAFCTALGSKPFRARQLMHWLYKRGCDRFEDMSDLARDFRAQLAERAEIGLPPILTRQQATDGTCKWLLSGGNDGQIRLLEAAVELADEITADAVRLDDGQGALLRHSL